MKKIGVYDNFVDAFKSFWSEMMSVLKTTGTSLQMLETANFIIIIDGAHKLPIGFYDARDLAYDIGLLVLEQPQSEPIVLNSPSVENWESIIAAKRLEFVQNILQDSLREIVDLTLSTLKQSDIRKSS